MSIRLITRFALVVVFVSAWNSHTLALQDLPKRAKMPEVSQVEDFDAKSLPKLAVLVLGSENTREQQSEYQRIVEDVFLESLLAKGHTVVARSDVDSLFKEKKFQNSGMTEEVAASVGKFLNVPAVFVIRINEVTFDMGRRSQPGLGKASIGARLLDVKTGVILWNGKHSESDPVSSKSACCGLVMKTAARLAEMFPEKTLTSDPNAKKIEPKSYPKLAVIMIGGASSNRRSNSGPGPGPGPGRQNDQQRMVEDAFIQVLTQKRYQLVSRSDLQSIAKEQQFQQSGLTEDNAVSVGKLLNVPAVLIVRITDFSTETREAPSRRQEQQRPASITRVGIGARLVDVGSGQLIWTHGEWITRDIVNKSEATDILDEAAKDVVNFLPPRPSKSIELIEQADRLERFFQKTAALNLFRAVVNTFPNSPEAEKAALKIKELTNK